MKNVFGIATLLACLAGCSTVTSKLNYSQDWPANIQEKTYTFEPSPIQKSNPDYGNYQNLVRAGLQTKGLTEAPADAHPALTVALNFSTTTDDTLYVVAPYPYGPYWGLHRHMFYGPGFYPYRFGYGYGYGYPGFYWPGYGFNYGYPYGFPMELEVRRYYEHQLDLVVNDASNGKKLIDISSNSESMDAKIAKEMPKLVEGAMSKFPSTAAPQQK